MTMPLIITGLSGGMRKSFLNQGNLFEFAQTLFF